MLHYFLIGLTYAFAAAIQPGPFQTYVISQAVTVGWRRCWYIGFAPLLSDIPIAILALSVLSVAPAWLLYVLQVAGGLFLLYLAFSVFKAWRHYQAHKEVKAEYGLFKAATVNLLNPNPYMGWSLIMGPLALKGWQEAPGCAFSLLVGFYGTMISTTVLIIILFSAASALGPKVNKGLLGMSGLALLLFAFFELWSGSSSLVQQW